LGSAQISDKITELTVLEKAPRLMSDLQAACVCHVRARVRARVATRLLCAASSFGVARVAERGVRCIACSPASPEGERG
jgi:hypothetical protein